MFVPHYAMSGGTLISLAADEIVMDPHAVLGSGRSAAGAVGGPLGAGRCSSERSREDIEDRTLHPGRRRAQGDRAGDAGRCKDLLERTHEPRRQAGSLAAKLATGTWTHDYGITAEEAKSLGLPISTEMPVEVYDFMGLFAQPTRTQPSVEYVPMPYRGAGPHRSSTGS